jgi:uncharacterized repeat protein (TIGR01451 family)
VRKVDDADPVQAGFHIHYSIYITNTAAAVINNVSVIDTLPSQTYYVNSNPGAEHSGGTVTWSIASLNAGAGVKLLLELGTYSTFSGTVTNNVTASAAGIVPAQDSETTTLNTPPATATPTVTGTPTPTATGTATSVPTATATPSRTPTATQSATPTQTPAPTATPTPSHTPTATEVPTPTPTLPAATATLTPSATWVPTVTATPTSRRYRVYLPLLLKTPRTP